MGENRQDRLGETKEQYKARQMKRQDPPAPKQSLARAADRQDFADLNNGGKGDAERETIRVGNTKASYKQAKDFQAEARIDEGRGGIESRNER